MNEPTTMPPADVLAILRRLEAAAVPVWLDGGWGVDALLRRQTRPHGDLDLVVARDDLTRLMVALRPLEFRHAPGEQPGLPARLVLRDPAGRQVDCHPVVFDERGDGRQELPDGSWGLYPADGLRGEGEIRGHPVRCLTAELQLRHHLGYEPDEQDRADVAHLAGAFGLPLPSSYDGSPQSVPASADVEGQPKG